VGCGKPFARHGARRDGDATANAWTAVASYEFVSATYGLTPARIEGELTDEQLAGYLDAAQDRLSAQADGEFRAMVEAVRAGTIFAHDKKQHARWTRSHSRPKRGTGLSGDALEAAVMRVASIFPDNVVHA
jgi:hypothetical protein